MFIEMRVFHTLIPVLLVGFLCVTIVEGDVDQVFSKLIGEKCVTNAGPKSVDRYENMMWYLQLACVRSPEGNLIQAREPSEIFHFYCDQVPAVQKCVKESYDFMKPCFKLEEQETVDIISNMTNSWMEFICDHEGKEPCSTIHRILDKNPLFLPSILFILAPDSPEQVNFKDFKSSSVQKIYFAVTAFTERNEWLESSGEALGNCFDEALSSYVPDVSSVRDPVTGLKTRFEKPLVLGVDDCLVMKKLQNCTVEALAIGKNQTTVELIESMIDSIISATPCESLLNEQVSTTLETPELHDPPTSEDMQMEEQSQNLTIIEPERASNEG